MQFDGFDWDRGNWEKCQKHGTSIAELESLFLSAVQISPDPSHSGMEQRFKAIGRSAAGRWIFLAFTWRNRQGRLLIRPISARYMHDREVKYYEALSSSQER